MTVSRAPNFKVGNWLKAVAGMAALSVAGCATAPAPMGISPVAGAPCRVEPRYECPEAGDCSTDTRLYLGGASELKTQRAFFLDYPCDLQPGEDVAFILNLHGFGSIGNWQRSYFPAVDQVENQRLVVATPSALQGQPRQGRWMGESDDQYLANIVDLVIEKFGRENISTFWLAGHSQGGMTSRRIVCSDYFASKVDGLLSLSGGRVGSVNRNAAAAEVPGCEFSHIYAIGEREAGVSLAGDESAWADHFGCARRIKTPDVEDFARGYVTASDQSRGPSWGTYARPGVAEVYVFDGCRDDRVVADVIRLEKGHTEGLEPLITEEVVRLMLSAAGGKIRNGG